MRVSIDAMLFQKKISGKSVVEIMAENHLSLQYMLDISKNESYPDPITENIKEYLRSLKNYTDNESDPSEELLEEHGHITMLAIGSLYK